MRCSPDRDESRWVGSARCAPARGDLRFDAWTPQVQPAGDPLRWVGVHFGNRVYLHKFTQKVTFLMISSHFQVNFMLHNWLTLADKYLTAIKIIKSILIETHAAMSARARHYISH